MLHVLTRKVVFFCTKRHERQHFRCSELQADPLYCVGTHAMRVTIHGGCQAFEAKF